jgi:hypothetical protein
MGGIKAISDLVDQPDHLLNSRLVLALDAHLLSPDPIARCLWSVDAPSIALHHVSSP